MYIIKPIVISVSYGKYPAVIISINYLTCELVHVEDLVYALYILWIDSQAVNSSSLSLPNRNNRSATGLGS